MFEDYPDVCSVDEACEALTIGKNTIYKLLNTHELEGLRIGNTWKVPRDSLRRFIARNAFTRK